MDSYSKNAVDINKVITNLTSVRNSVEFLFRFLFKLQWFQMHNLAFHFSPRASKLICVRMNLIGHFRIIFGLIFKASPGAHPFI